LGAFELIEFNVIQPNNAKQANKAGDDRASFISCLGRKDNNQHITIIRANMLNSALDNGMLTAMTQAEKNPIDIAREVKFLFNKYILAIVI
jgi:hypothetical protein